MDISNTLQWWDEWQLSVLVLSSLGVRCFLVLAAGARKSRSGPVYRSAIWLSYLGGDALAIYALAALLNIQKKAQNSSADRASRALQVLWAPIMLMHLGGLANISAYNIEDNDLWRRHIATSVSQVAVALYVFCKLWPSSADKRLLAAVILLFIPGIVKCFEKPLALRRSSFYSLVSQPTSLSKKADNEEQDLKEYSYILQAAIDIFKKRPSVKKTSKELESLLENKSRSESKGGHTGYLMRPDKLFVDLGYPYSERLKTFECFWTLSKQAAYRAIATGISNTFDLLYTKDFTMDSENRDESLFDNALTLCTWACSLVVPIAAIGLLHSSHKEAYKGSDVKISLVLLYVTWFVELWSCGTLSDHEKLAQWHGSVSQHNLIALFARNKRHSWLTSIAEFLGCKDFFDQSFRIKPASGDGSNAEAITGLVHAHVENGWLEISNEYDSASQNKGSRSNNIAEMMMMMSKYWEFSDTRGHKRLLKKPEEYTQVFRPVLDMAFDEAVLIWHLATDFCFFTRSPDLTAEGMALASRVISNYMMHLLFSNPEMLLPGSRRYLCTFAYQEIVGIFNAQLKTGKEDVEQQSPPQGNKQEAPMVEVDEEAVARILFDVDARPIQGLGNGSFVDRACEIAHELKKLESQQQMWEVIQGVWVEMLCFSATRCRGYLHAKSLGAGGEYLTFVWLLMAYAGMETFPERQQRAKVLQQQAQAASL